MLDEHECNCGAKLSQPRRTRDFMMYRETVQGAEEGSRKDHDSVCRNLHCGRDRGAQFSHRIGRPDSHGKGTERYGGLQSAGADEGFLDKTAYGGEEVCAARADFLSPENGSIIEQLAIASCSVWVGCEGPD